MSSKKKLTVKRLVIFLVISFLPLSMLIPILWAVYGEPLYSGKNEQLAVISYLTGVFGMMVPAVAHLITRLVTKEGFDNTYLGVHFKGKEGYWFAAMAVKLIEGWAGLFLLWAVFMKGTAFNEAYPNINMQNMGAYLLQLAASIIIFFPAFGEEWGWRGYMMPKLLELMPKPAAVIVGGIIWGLWHAPLTIAGHNFGTDYPGYPFTGILMMCLFCVLMNCFLTLVTEKTRSIYPASFIHMINNSLGAAILLTVFGSETAIKKVQELNSIELFFAMTCFTAMTAVISFVLFIKKDKSKIESI
ncbi:CPBP family intramembrane glutamic endopeptidase [Ruminococcus albus]|uniref:CAAX protease self-immunity n=1 Tax=Ruminococcus albus TaxID=1264 RepID=A0A1H7MKF2_RUMAL|nr:CPBP family intramembrane glutamic endopeptidase [Ruminococcus albus]SEL11368.1 CAAX protease self-immunity [Ruminococcus albus]